MVIATVAALALMATMLPESDLGGRIGSSAAGSQALQGPLDGTWALYDASNHPLYVLQISDPAGGTGALEAAWRGPGVSAPSGFVTAITRRGDGLSISFVEGEAGEPVSIRLQRRTDDAWVGGLTANGPQSAVTLQRIR